MSIENTSISQSIDLCDLHCPHLLIAVIQSLESLSPGQILQIRATDLNAPSSISAWSRQSGTGLLELYEENGCFVFYLQRGGQDSLFPYKDKSVPKER